MFKVMVMAKKKPGISREEFIERYENGHIPLTDRLIANGDIPPMLDYKRNYLSAADTEESDSPGFDVITEVWYNNRDEYENNMKSIAGSKLAEQIANDMKSFMDVSTLRYYVVDEFPK